MPAKRSAYLRRMTATTLKRRFCAFLRTHSINYKLHQHGLISIGYAWIDFDTEQYIVISFVSAAAPSGVVRVSYPVSDWITVFNKFVAYHDWFVTRNHLQKNYTPRAIVIQFASQD